MMILKILKSRSAYDEPLLRSRCRILDGPCAGQLVLKISNRVVENDWYDEAKRIWIQILNPAGQIGWVVEEYQFYGHDRLSQYSERFVAEL